MRKAVSNSSCPSGEGCRFGCGPNELDRRLEITSVSRVLTIARFSWRDHETTTSGAPRLPVDGFDTASSNWKQDASSCTRSGRKSASRFLFLRRRRRIPGNQFGRRNRFESASREGPRTGDKASFSAPLKEDYALV